LPLDRNSSEQSKVQGVLHWTGSASTSGCGTRGWCAPAAPQPRSPLAASGHVRLNSQRIDAASRTVRAGDVVTIALDRSVRVLKVSGFAERRGSADDAQALYEDLSPAPRRAGVELEPPSAERERGAGRPTKRERRAIGRFTGEDGQ
jgi:ribosome-associated heat shock protein Hsp15